jgi:uncharacterized protein (UPF0276 family)
LPTLIEWDNDVPDWMTLCREAQKAKLLLEQTVRTKAA